MPITVTCKCAKRFQARDDLAGKKVRCPACKAIVTVPRPAPPRAAPKPAATTRVMPRAAVPKAPTAKPPAPGAAATKPPATKAPPPKAAPPTRLAPKAEQPKKPAARTMLAPAALPIRFHCTCGRQLLADPANAGRKMRCSACAAVVPIPVRSEESPFLARAAPAEKPAASVDVWADRSLEQRLTPWRDERAERQGAGRYPEPRSLAWLAALVVLLVLAGVGAAGYLWWPDITAYVNRRAAEDAKAAGRDGGIDWSGYSDLDLVPRDAVALMTLRVADAWDLPAAKQYRKKLPRGVDAEKGFIQFTGFSPADVERVTVATPGVPGGEIFVNDASVVLVLTREPYDRDKVRSALCGNPLPSVEGTALFRLARLDEAAVAFLNERLLAFGTRESLGGFLRTPPRPRDQGTMSDAIELAGGDHLFTAALRSPVPLSKIVQPGLLPPDFKQFAPLLALDGFTLTLDARKGLAVDLKATYPDKAKSNSGRKSLLDALKRGQGEIAALRKKAKPADPHADLALELAERLLSRVKVSGKDREVRAALRAEPAVTAEALTVVLPAAEKVGRALAEAAANAQRMRNENNLRQLATAVQEYVSVNGSYPPEVFGKGLSWRVAILPYLQHHDLYSLFRQDEPWDSPHNLRLLEKMPRVFETAGRPTAEPFTTYYRVFAGPGTLFNGPTGVSKAAVTDGPANTFLAVEAADAVPWTAPQELPFNRNAPMPRLGGLLPDRFLAVAADGRVYLLRRNLPAGVMRAWITRAGGERPPAQP